MLKPISLDGHACRLEPLRRGHADHLRTAAGHDEIWTYLDQPTPGTLTAMTRLIDEAAQAQERGERIPFAVIDVETGRAVGSTSFLDIQPADRSVEIGWTWLTPATWGGSINPEMKLLLLTHLFEDEDAIRVCLKTDSRNLRSRRAISALGAKEEGVLRNHRILRNGHRRHSAYYSIIAEDWPQVRSRLSARLAASRLADGINSCTWSDRQ
jgi:N-acetyltransferase